MFFFQVFLRIQVRNCVCCILTHLLSSLVTTRVCPTVRVKNLLNSPLQITTPTNDIWSVECVCVFIMATIDLTLSDDSDLELIDRHRSQKVRGELPFKLQEPC